MKYSLRAGTALLTIMAGSSAYAADLARPVRAPAYSAPAPQFSWTGCYVGGNLGVGAGQTKFADPVADGNIDANIPGQRTAIIDKSGGVAGGQIGCDYQFGGNLVVGIAGSLNGSDIRGISQDPFNFTWTLRDTVQWYGTVTGRIGTAINNTLLYAKGGAVFAHDQFEIENSNMTLGIPSVTRTGWTLGAGIEWSFAPNWSAFGEANYYGFSSRTETFNQNLNFIMQPPNINIKPSFETLTIGVNYRFGGYGAVSSRY